MKREDRELILRDIHVGSFILCVDSAECRWNVYKAKTPGTDYHSRNRGVIFTGEPYYLPDEISPFRYWGCHYAIESTRYNFTTDAIDCDAVSAIYQDHNEMLAVAEQLREQERQYVEATEVFRDRFRVFAKLATD